MILLLALHAVLGIASFASGRRLGRWCLALVAIAPLATFVWLLIQAPRIIDGRPITQTRGGCRSSASRPRSGSTASVCVMALIVSGVGLLVLAYSASYFAPDDRRARRLAGLLMLFAGAMLGVVLADNLSCCSRAGS